MSAVSTSCRLRTRTLSAAEPLPRLLGVIESSLRDLRPGGSGLPAVTLDSVLDRDLGLDSLSRMELLLRIERELGLALPEDTLQRAETVADLLRAVRSALKLAAKRKAENSTRNELAARHATLTPRESEVMALVVTGMLNKQIAAQLGTGEQNIKIHRGRMMKKMDVRSLADLVRVAERLGIGKTPDV